MKISIITASYNYANYIADAIESVLAQTFTDWELIVVDDGSSDNSVEIIKSYCEKDGRIKFFQHDCGVNKGLKETLKLAIANATGEWVAFLESDDVLLSENLLEKTKIIDKHPDVVLVFNKVELFGDENSIALKRASFENIQNELSKMIFPTNMFKLFYQHNMILTFSSVLVKKEALLNLDYNSPVKAFLDWWLWIQLAYKNEFYYIDKTLSKWRLHSDSYIQSSKKPCFPILQPMAYFEVAKKHKDFTLVLFIMLSQIRLIFKKLKNKLR